jgi:glucose-6-phosphate 1-dehydrogenase
VPFYLRTGKRLPKKLTQIAVRFREAPVSYFRKLGCKSDSADVLIITLQPNEGFSFHLDIKVPGEVFRLEQIPLRFHYRDRYQDMREAYQMLLLDILRGDQTLFVHSDEVEESWKLFMPLLQDPPKCKPYPCGTWGPREAEALAIPEGRLWQAEE